MEQSFTDKLRKRMEWWKSQPFITKAILIFAAIMIVGIISTFFNQAKAAELTASWTFPTHSCDGTAYTQQQMANFRTELFYSTDPIPAKDQDCSVPGEGIPPGNLPLRQIGPGITSVTWQVVGGFTYYVRARVSNDPNGQLWSNLSSQAMATKPEDPTQPPVDPPPGGAPTYRPALIFVDDGSLFVGGPFGTVMRFDSDATIAKASGRWKIEFGFTKETCSTDTQVVLSRDEGGQTDPGHVSFAVQDIGTGCELRVRLQAGDPNVPAWAGNAMIDMSVPGASHVIMFSFGADIVMTLDDVAVPPSVSPFPMGMDLNSLPLIFGGTCWSKQNAEATCGPGMAEEPTAVFGGWSSLQIFDE